MVFLDILKAINITYLSQMSYIAIRTPTFRYIWDYPKSINILNFFSHTYDSMKSILELHIIPLK